MLNIFILQMELKEKWICSQLSYWTEEADKGLYCFNRLPYGIALAPAIFQQIIEQILLKLPKVVCYIDDILLTGRNDEEHLQSFTAIIESIRHHGFWIKLSKCKIFQESVKMDMLWVQKASTPLRKKSKESKLLSNRRFQIVIIP